MEDKKQARTESFARRKACFDPGRAEVACGRLLSHIENLPQTSRVSGYWPMRTEIDPRACLHLLHEKGMDICLPVVLGAAQPLVFRVWTPETIMVEGAFGAMIPEQGAEVEPDVLIVPLLAFDRAGYRLGYGGGFYDRTLERLRAIRQTYAVGFAFAGQEVRAVPREATDEPLDAIVTESETIVFAQ